MTDFLGWLAQRALGVAPLVRPRHSSRFEPVPEAPLLMQPEHPPPFAGSEPPAIDAPLSIAPRVIMQREIPAVQRVTPPATAAPPSPAPSPARPSVAVATSRGVAAMERESPALQGRPEATSPEPITAERADVPRPEPSQSQLHPAAAPSVLIEPSAIAITQQLSVHNEAAHSTVHTRSSSHFNTHLSAPPPVRVPAAPPTRTRAPDSPPSVHVTIGRLEVRALAPSPPAVIAAPARTVTPRLSLDQYLRRAKGVRDE